MDKERLDELRERVFFDYQEWDIKCSKDGFQEASPTGEMDADGKDLTALINAEIARQSVTGEAVQRAIEDIESVKGYLNDVCNHQSVRTYDSLDLAIKLLHQHQKPTDEAVQRALSELGFETSFELQSWWCKHGSLAITALRQMRSEPCEICGNFKHIECKADNLEFTAVRCPNCGKELVKHDG